MKLFLSRLVLDPRSRQVRQDFLDTYQMHRTLCRAFADEAMPSELAKQILADARLLFRVDPDKRGHPTALVQSQVEPEWSRVNAEKGYFAQPPEVKHFSTEFSVGKQLAFHVRANPTVKRQGKRLGLYRDEEQANWLQRKSEQHGFSLEAFTAQIEDRAARARGKGDEVQFLAVRFTGTLRVSHPLVFAEAIATGIGSAKAFGFGLLSIARPV